MKFIQSSAKSILLLVSVVTIVGVCFALALWQYHRAQEKLTITEQLALTTQKGVLPWQKLTSLPAEWVTTGLKVSLSGSLAKQIWWVDNQVVNGRFGYDLVVAVRPLSSPRWWLVNLGWFAGDFQRSQLPDVSLPSDISVSGILKVNNFKGFSLAKNESEVKQGNRVQFMTPELAAKSLNHDVAPYLLYADPADALGKYHYQVINMSPDKHLAYALQWLLLALSALVIGIILHRKGGHNE